MSPQARRPDPRARAGRPAGEDRESEARARAGREDRASEARARAGREDRESEARAPQGPPRAVSRSALADLAIMLGALALCTAIAALAGAPNLGTALSFGQIAFALAAVYVVLRR